MTGQTEREAVRGDLFKYTSVKRITKIPVVESGYNYVSGIYSRVKNSNRLIHWSLVNVEGGIQLAVDKTMPTVLLLDLPLTVVDSIICKGLDTVAVAIPAINYPPEMLVHMSKDYVNSNLITPVLNRADSVKQLGINEANRVGEMAASRLDTALDIADKYVDRYLPDSADSAAESKKEQKTESVESKTSHAIHHMNRLGKKLQRRLTKRTLMEAEALKRGSQDLAQTLIYLADLLLRDPKGFADKISELWNTLSQDEPENQVPPANLEQLMVLLMRESARRAVHITNFIVSTVPAQTSHAFRFTLHHLQIYTNYFLKIVHLEGAKGIAFATSTERLYQLRSFILNLLEILGSRIKDTKRISGQPLKPITSTDSNPGSSVNQPQTTDQQTESDRVAPKTPAGKKNKDKSSKNKQKDSSPNSTSSTDQPSSELDDSSASSTLEASLTVNSTPYSSPLQ